MAALVLLLRAGLIAVRRCSPGSQRLLAGATFAAVLGYGIHALYDWDWEIPAVTLPALLFLGVLVSTRAREGEAGPRPRGIDRVPLGRRAIGLIAATLWLGAFALSVELPQLASSQAGAALVDASSSSPALLARAQSTAAAASALDPLSDVGLRAQVTLAIHLGRPGSARLDLQQAVQRDPADVEAWKQLAYVDALVRDDSGARQAAQRVVELDPHGPGAANLVLTRLAQAPPQASPTARPTPLPLP